MDDPHTFLKALNDASRSFFEGVGLFGEIFFLTNVCCQEIIQMELVVSMGMEVYPRRIFMLSPRG